VSGRPLAFPAALLACITCAGVSQAAGDTKPPAAAMKTEAQIAAVDVNRDGKITREEAAGHPELLEVFKERDRNGDGVLEASELSGSGGGALGE